MKDGAEQRQTNEPMSHTLRRCALSGKNHHPVHRGAVLCKVHRLLHVWQEFEMRKSAQMTERQTRSVASENSHTCQHRRDHSVLVVDVRPPLPTDSPCPSSSVACYRSAKSRVLLFRFFNSLVLKVPHSHASTSSSPCSPNNVPFWYARDFFATTKPTIP